MSAFHLITQVDISIVQTLFLIESSRDVYVDLCHYAHFYQYI